MATLNHELHIFLGCQHVPYEDPWATALVQGFLRAYHPGTVHLLGDLIDAYQISKHSRDPSRRIHLQEEFDRAYEYTEGIRTILGPEAVIHLSEGNHEWRLPALIWSQAPALECLRSVRAGVPGQLRLSELDVKWHPITTPYRQGHLWIKHGTRISPHSAYTARMEMERAGGCIIHSHTHRLGAHYKTQYDGIIGGFENGCLCLIDPRIHQWTKGLPNWQNGFSVAQFFGKKFQLEQVLLLGSGASMGYIFHGRWHGIPQQTAARIKRERR